MRKTHLLPSSCLNCPQAPLVGSGVEQTALFLGFSLPGLYIHQHHCAETIRDTSPGLSLVRMFHSNLGMGFPRSHLLSKRRVLENFVQNIHFFAPLIITVFFLCRLNSALLSDIIKGNRDSLNSKKIKLFKETPRLPTKGSFFIAFILSLIEFYFYEDLQNRTFFYVLTICRYFFCVPLSKRMVFMRVALYIRVSTQEQAEEGSSGFWPIVRREDGSSLASLLIQERAVLIWSAQGYNA